MLRVDVRELRHGPVATAGSLPAADPLFEGLGVALAEPLVISGSLETTARGDYFWKAQLASRAHVACRRCLKKFVLPVTVPVEAVFSTNPDLQDDPSVYPLMEPVASVDVTAAVREELALAAAAYPLCREDCAGLCPRCGADLNQGPCDCPGAKAH